MRTFFHLMLFVIVTALSSTPANADDSNQLPMYGGHSFTPAQEAANAQFSQQAISMYGSAEKASQASSALGFKYLFEKRDPATAMKRFNQSYLLNPNNGAAYQGMAITVMIRDNDTQTAESLFKKAAAATAVNPDIFADYGRFLMMQKRPEEAVPVLQRGVSLDANYVETGSLLAAALYESGQKAQACPYAATWQHKAQPAIAATLRTILADPVCQHKE